MSKIVEGKDFYYNADGFVVLNSSYHLQKGKCCGSGCTHCPYQYENVEKSKREILLKERPPILLFSKN